MTMTLEKPPEACGKLISEHVPYLLVASGAVNARNPSITRYRVAAPHPLYSTAFGPTETIENDCSLRGWQYLILRGNSVVKSAEIGQRQNDSDYIFTVLREGAFAEAICSTLRKAEKLPEVRDRDYELRFVRVPTLYFRAAWLHRSDDDIFIPMGRSTGKLQKDEPYRADTVNATLREIVERRQGRVR